MKNSSTALLKPKIIIRHKKSLKKKYINIIFVILYLFFFMISYYLYYLSLEKCFEGFDICCNKIEFIKVKLIQLILSSLITSILIELIFYHFISKLNFIHLIIIYFKFYKYSHGKDFNDHGFFNFYGTLVICILILISLLPFNGLLYFIKKKNNIKLYLYLIFLLIIISFYFVYIKGFMKCNDWPLGLNNR